MNTFIEDLSSDLRGEQVKQNLVPVVSNDGKRWIDLSQRLGEVRSTTDRPISREITKIEDLSEIIPGMIKVTYLEDCSVQIDSWDDSGKRSIEQILQHKEQSAIIHPLSNKYELSDDGETLVIFPMKSGTSLLGLLGYQYGDISDDEAGQVALEEAGGFEYSIFDTFTPVEDENGLLAVNPVPVPVPKQN